MTTPTQAQINQVRELYKQFRAQTPSSPDWFQVIDACVDILMQNYIADLEDRMPMVGLPDD